MYQLISKCTRVFGAKNTRLLDFPIRQGIRTLYTNQIYPYPNFYVKQVICKSQAHYRETWVEDEWVAREQTWGKIVFTFFWAHFFYQVFDNPGAYLGHYALPDPSKWTDEELGIPPLEMGSYEDWLLAKDQDHSI